jgi:hypothetical protein
MRCDRLLKVPKRVMLAIAISLVDRRGDAIQAQARGFDLHQSGAASPHYSETSKFSRGRR